VKLDKRGQLMRDIRGDLQERANMFEQQINAAQQQCEKLIDQLKREKDSRLADLKAELDAVNRVLEIEHRRLRSATSVPKSQPQQPLANFLVIKLSEVGPMSSQDLCRLALQEGYFTDSNSAQEGVHAMLMEVVKAGHIQQLPNAKFAPVLAVDMPRLRRAI
jgi:chromosome segregation ATPase